MTVLRVTVVNHGAVEVAAPPSALWAAILTDMAQGQSFVRFGYWAEALDDPTAYLGGTHLRFKSPERSDEIVYRITERNDAAMRLSLKAEFLSPASNGMVSFATYQAIPTAGGSLYRMDAHSTVDHSVADDASRADIAKSVAALHAQFDQGIVAALKLLGARIEEEGKN